MMDRLRNLFKGVNPEQLPAAMMQETGWSESKLYSKDIPKYNPDDLIGRKGPEIYKKMMLDEQVKAVVHFKRDAVTSRDHVFEFPEDTELSDTEKEERIAIYKASINKTKGSFSDGLNFIMKALQQGFSMTEKTFDVFEYKGRPYLGVSHLTPKPYDSFQFHTNKVGQVERTVQKIDNDEQDIDLAKFVYFVNNPDKDRHYGQSDLREAYRSWYSKDVAVRFSNQFLERLAGGLIVGRAKEGTTLRMGSADYNAVLAVLNNVTVSTSILLPSNIELEVTNPKATKQFEEHITFHDLQIAKALLVPNLLGISHAGQTGSFSQSQTQLEAFLWTLDALAARLEDTLNEQVFDVLSALNFADGVGPKFKFKPVSEEMKLKVIKAWQELVGAGAVEASDTDEKHVREMMDFPEKGEPIKSAPPLLQPDPSPSGPQPPALDDGDEEEGLPDETLAGKAIIRVAALNAARTRAFKRVAFAVIDRRSRNIEERHTVLIEQQLASMVAGLVGRIEDEKLGTPAGGVDGLDKVDFATKDKTKVRRVIDATLIDAWKLGVRHADDEVAKAKSEQFQVNMGRIDEDAAAFLKTNGFRMLGNLTNDMKKIVQNLLVNGVKFSWTTNDIVRKLYDQLTLAGFVLMSTNATATGRVEDEVIEALQEATGGAHRLKTAVRTNTFEAINEARYSVFTDPGLGNFVEALEYSAILDSRTSDICSHLDGRVYPVTSDQWNSIRPPNHYNCRSILVPVTVVDTDVTGKDHEPDSRLSKPPSKEPQRGFGGDLG